MNPNMKHLIAASLAALLAGTTGAASAQVGPAKEAATPGTARSKEEIKDATTHVNQAVQVVARMQASPEMRALLQRAKGVFVVPKYAEAALGVGARGGAGVLLVRSGNTANPQADSLRQALADLSSGKGAASMGTSGTGGTTGSGQERDRNSERERSR